MSMNKIIAAVLALVMVFGLMGCCAPAASADAEPRTIYIGVWWDIFYDSTHEAPEDDPSYDASVSAVMHFENVARIEEKYNVRFEYVNMTFDGVKESINTSILAGTPDCDIYLCDVQFGIPAALSGLGTDMRTVLPEDADVLSDRNIVNFLDLGDGKVTLMTPAGAQSAVENTWPLAFNVQMLEDNNLEDPRELYARGEWTWDKFIEYCQVLTQDTDGDGVLDQFGYDGFSKDTLKSLLLSNGASIASGATETLSSPEVGECLKFLSDMYNVYNICEPYVWESPWDVCRFRFSEGNVGFWPGAPWVFGQNNCYDPFGESGTTVGFDTAFVQWPVGPSGNQETNKGVVTQGNYYMIPAGVEDPELVYNVFEDICNWYDGDTEIRDDPEGMYWWYAVHAKDEDLQVENFEVMLDMGSKAQFDLWDSIGVEMDMDALIRGDVTAAQHQEAERQKYQEALDAYFG